MNKFIGKGRVLINYVVFIVLTHFYKVIYLFYTGPLFNEIDLANIALELDKK